MLEESVASQYARHWQIVAKSRPHSENMASGGVKENAVQIDGGRLSRNAHGLIFLAAFDLKSNGAAYSSVKNALRGAGIH